MGKNIKVVIVGAGGRMGRRLVARVAEAEDMELVGATEYPESPFVGSDAGTLAGIGETGVAVSVELEPVLSKADAVVDFSTGDVVANAEAAVSAGAAVVIGTTALDAAAKGRLAELAGNGGRIVLAPNMSVGVNLLFHLVAEVAKTLGDDYDIEIVETHHNKKKDAPSGTAVRLAEVAAEALGRSYDKDVVHGREGIVGERTRREIGVHAVRGGDVVGDHVVLFAGDGERVELVHKASSRDTFALGALKAARFLQSSAPGLYDMMDVLGLRRKDG